MGIESERESKRRQCYNSLSWRLRETIESEYEKSLSGGSERESRMSMRNLCLELLWLRERESQRENGQSQIRETMSHTADVGALA